MPIPGTHRGFLFLTLLLILLLCTPIQAREGNWCGYVPPGLHIKPVDGHAIFVDREGAPLPGLKVTIADTGQVLETNSAGLIAMSDLRKGIPAPAKEKKPAPEFERIGRLERDISPTLYVDCQGVRVRLKPGNVFVLPLGGPPTIPETTLQMQILRADGKPASGLWVELQWRDDRSNRMPEEFFDKSFATDASGKLNLDLTRAVLGEVDPNARTSRSDGPPTVFVKAIIPDQPDMLPLMDRWVPGQMLTLKMTGNKPRQLKLVDEKRQPILSHEPFILFQNSPLSGMPQADLRLSSTQSLRLPDGEYILTSSKHYRSFRVKEGVTADEIILAPAPPLKYSGVVIDAETGKPRPQTLVVLYSFFLDAPSPVIWRAFEKTKGQRQLAHLPQIDRRFDGESYDALEKMRYLSVAGWTDDQGRFELEFPASSQSDPELSVAVYHEGFLLTGVKHWDLKKTNDIQLLAVKSATLKLTPQGIDIPDRDKNKTEDAVAPHRLHNLQYRLVFDSPQNPQWLHARTIETQDWQYRGVKMFPKGKQPPFFLWKMGLPLFPNAFNDIPVPANASFHVELFFEGRKALSPSIRLTPGQTHDLTLKLPDPAQDTLPLQIVDGTKQTRIPGLQGQIVQPSTAKTLSQGAANDLGVYEIPRALLKDTPPRFWERIDYLKFVLDMSPQAQKTFGSPQFSIEYDDHDESYKVIIDRSFMALGVDPNLQLLNAQGKPLADVSVYAQGWLGTTKLKTDARGILNLPQCASVLPQRLIVESAGQKAAILRIPTPGTPLTLPLSQPTPPASQPMISGQVTDENAIIIPGCAVSALWVKKGPGTNAWSRAPLPQVGAVTDENGKFTLPRPPKPNDDLAGWELRLVATPPRDAGVGFRGVAPGAENTCHIELPCAQPVALTVSPFKTDKEEFSFNKGTLSLVDPATRTIYDINPASKGKLTHVLSPGKYMLSPEYIGYHGAATTWELKPNQSKATVPSPGPRRFRVTLIDKSTSKPLAGALLFGGSSACNPGEWSDSIWDQIRENTLSAESRKEMSSRVGHEWEPAVQPGHHAATDASGAAIVTLTDNRECLMVAAKGYCPQDLTSRLPTATSDETGIFDLGQVALQPGVRLKLELQSPQAYEDFATGLYFGRDMVSTIQPMDATYPFPRPSAFLPKELPFIGGTIIVPKNQTIALEYVKWSFSVWDRTPSHVRWMVSGAFNLDTWDPKTLKPERLVPRPYLLEITGPDGQPAAGAQLTYGLSGLADWNVRCQATPSGTLQFPLPEGATISFWIVHNQRFYQLPPQTVPLSPDNTTKTIKLNLKDIPSQPALPYEKADLDE